MTEKLYEKDAYCREFSATVISCTENGGGYDVVLDKTAFFPEGGGQAADKGTLDGKAVLDVHIHNGTIIHRLASPIPCEKTVEGKLDWPLRFERMQRHSGEHVLSGVVHSRFGYNNVGFHMSESEMTVDFDGVLSGDDIETVEKVVNRLLWENRRITVFYPTEKETGNFSYRSKLENIEKLRLVEIEGVDCCACCAPHVSRTGEIGIVKIIDATPNKGGVRLTVLAGITALRDYSMLNSLNKQMMKTLSVSRECVADAVMRETELLDSLRRENALLSDRLAWSELSPYRVNGSAYAFSENLTYDSLRHCANMLLAEGNDTALLFSTDDGAGYIYVIGSSGRDVRPIVKELNEAYMGKGGGRPNYAQGKVACDSIDSLKAFAERVL